MDEITYNYYISRQADIYKYYNMVKDIDIEELLKTKNNNYYDEENEMYITFEQLSEVIEDLKYQMIISSKKDEIYICVNNCFEFHNSQIGDLAFDHEVIIAPNAYAQCLSTVEQYYNSTYKHHVEPFENKRLTKEELIEFGFNEELVDEAVLVNN